HTITQRMLEAEREFQSLLSKQSRDYESAVQAYQVRRRKPPPSGFREWFNVATKYNALLIEEFWDTIYEDLEPFQKIPPRVLQVVAQQATAISGQNNVEAFWFRDGKPGTGCYDMNICLLFMQMLEAVAEEAPGVIPDMRIPFNGFISPRIWPKWNDLTDMKWANETEGIPDARDTLIAWSQGMRSSGWESHGNNHALVKAACPPDSLLGSQALPIESSSSGSSKSLAHMDGGFVSDYQQSKNPCHQPDLLHIHGSFVDPIYQLTTTDLFPLFSLQKIASINREIVVPWPLYWSSHAEFFAPDTDTNWSQKDDKLFWRGGNSGGRVKSSNWKGFQRHRLVTLVNATETRAVLRERKCDTQWAMTDGMCRYLLGLGKSEAEGILDVLERSVDIAFSAFGCSEQDPPRVDGISGCEYLDGVYQHREFVPLRSGQKNKYLVDIDGNGFSGRFRSFLLSKSVPLKASVYNEWHDSRLVPWKHFIPLDNRLGDLWSVLGYFMGFCFQHSGKDCASHDAEAMRIGLEGSEWAKNVLRKEDMTLYLMRLLLEYGRL
ncbi:hypothetical protein LZ30DRAFT_536528, partial [Colletotrichum cereale]